jgi:folate-binding protein YgfZ
MIGAIEGAPKRTPLFDAQRSLGARFREAFGWEMVASYGDPRDECRKVRAAAGLIDLSFLGAIKVWGREAVQFLNGLVTNDVKSLNRGQGMRAAFLTPHGKVRALCRVLSLGEEFLIENDPHTHAKVYSYIEPFSRAGDFKLEDVSDSYCAISVQGPNSYRVLKEVCFEPVPQLSEHHWIETIIGGERVIVVKASRTGDPGYDLLVPASGLKDVWDFLLLKGSFHSLIPFGLEALDILRIEAGVPVYGIDVDESNMMLEVGLADAVSFTKGCYTGQEAVAKATYRGHVSKKLSGLAVASDRPPDRGDRIFKDDKDIGYVTSAIFSETLGAVIAMGYIKYGFFDPGTSVKIRTSIGLLPATVVELPFYRSPHR